MTWFLLDRFKRTHGVQRSTRPQPDTTTDSCRERPAWNRTPLEREDSWNGMGSFNVKAPTSVTRTCGSCTELRRGQRPVTVTKLSHFLIFHQNGKPESPLPFFLWTSQSGNRTTPSNFWLIFWVFPRKHQCKIGKRMWETNLYKLEHADRCPRSQLAVLWKSLLTKHVH